MKLRCLLVLALAGTCGAVPYGHAAEPLRLDEAVARAMAAHPTLAAEAATIRAAQARADRAGLATPYTVGGELENVAGTGSVSGVKSAEATVRIARLIELGGKRSARQALGAAEVRRAEHAAAVARIDVMSRVTERFIEVLADQQRLAQAHEQVRLAEQTRREIASWVAAARNPESDLRAAEIAVADAELRREHAEHELASARTSLAAAWGATTPDFKTVSGNLRQLPSVEPLDELLERLPEAAAQRGSEFEIAEIEAQRRVAIANARPDINVSLGVRRLEALDDQALVMAVSVPLGTKTRSRLEVAEADARMSAVEQRRAAARLEGHQALFEAYQELLHARTEYEAVTKRMLPKAEQAVAFTRRGFELGRFSFIALTQAQKTLFDLRVRGVEAAARYHTRLVEIERLTALPSDTRP